MILLKLSFKSILNRKLTSILLILSIALSSMLLIGIQKVKISAKRSFSQSISGTDLIVGARTGDIQLLLYSVFRQGQAISNMSWDNFKNIEARLEIKWAIPLSLGDSHRGFPVIGTSDIYFNYYKYKRKKSLEFTIGRPFKSTYEVVIGSDVEKEFKYKLGNLIYISHGVSKSNLPLHKNKPFKIVGILKKTGTPVDKTLHIPLEGMTALHVNTTKDNIDLTPKSITSCLVGLKSKFDILSVQRQINSQSNEPLMAIIPGVTLSRLWNTISTVDTAFFIITMMVMLIAFIGLLLALFMSLYQRKKELAILRTLGAHPFELSIILMLESLIITVTGSLIGIILTIMSSLVLKPFFENTLGLVLSFKLITLTELYMVIGIIGFSLIVSFIPAILAYKKGVSEGFISVQ